MIKDQRRGLYESIQSLDAAWDVSWSYGEPVREDMPDRLVSLRIISGPTPATRSGARGAVVTPPEVLTATVGPVVVGDALVLHLRRSWYRYEIQPGDTPDTAAAALGALLDERNPGVTVAAAGPTLTITATERGALDLARGAGPWSTLTAVDGPELLRVDASQIYAVSVDTYAPTLPTEADAWSMAEQIRGALESLDVSEALSAYGLGLAGKGSPLDLSDIAGARYNSRVTWTVTVYAQLYRYTPTATIEQVDTEITI